MACASAAIFSDNDRAHRFYPPIASPIAAMLQPKPETNVLQGMEYRGIRYTIRTRIERDQWSVAIHPAGVEMKGRVVIGSRSDAELQARAMINDWLKKHSTQTPISN
jgi:hypothetical protein